ncbi:MAG: hypothetical protein R3A46_19745 [Thermomicrobiales bacterium]
MRLKHRVIIRWIWLATLSTLALLLIPSVWAGTWSETLTTSTTIQTANLPSAGSCQPDSGDMDCDPPSTCEEQPSSSDDAESNQEEPDNRGYSGRPLDDEGKGGSSNDDESCDDGSSGGVETCESDDQGANEGCDGYEGDGDQDGNNGGTCRVEDENGEFSYGPCDDEQNEDGEHQDGDQPGGDQGEDPGQDDGNGRYDRD